MHLFFHEQRYRTDPVMAKIKDFPVTICGAGALGSNLCENLARSGFGHLKIIDRDRIEEHNLSTQPYHRSDVGAFKAKILTHDLYRAIGTKVEAESKPLTADNVTSLLHNSRLIVDCFDNSVSRQVVKDFADQTGISCLHMGLSADYAEVIWNSDYRVPSAINDDVCDYPLARNLVMLTIAVAAEAIVNFIATGEQHSFTITLKDMSIQAWSA